jgi:hypothetical protein
MALGWLKVGTGLALAVIAAFVMIHPDVDLLEGIFHPGQDAHQELASAITVVLDGPPVVAATAPLDTTPVLTAYRPDSLDLQCARLC